MHRLTVTLKQHTPLIHFQHDQDGATLRASEVKPKLDRFIITKLGSGNYDQGLKIAIEKGWVLNDGKNDCKALNYKMRIKAEGKSEFLIASLLNVREPQNCPFRILPNTPYFAQEQFNSSTKEIDNPVFLKYRNDEGRWQYDLKRDNWGAIDKKGLMWTNIELTITALNDKIGQIVEDNLPQFFLCTNFGTRSSKGFGSFTVNVRNTENNAEDVLKTNFKFVYKKQMQGGLPQIFKGIKDDYQKIKSGVNFNGYTKSILFCYAVEKMTGNPRWEKRFFKQQMSGGLQTVGLKLRHEYNQGANRPNAPIADSKGQMNWKDVPAPYNYLYLRSVLGLAEQYEFLLDGTNNNRVNDKAKVKVKSNDMERYQSPLLFKVIGNTVYVVGNEVPSEVLGKTFSFSFTKGTASITPDKQLKSPAQFDLLDFMTYAMGARFKLGYTNCNNND